MTTAEGIAASPFGEFMASAPGRILRVAAGLALIVIGVFIIGDTAGWVIAAVGLLPLAAGAFDFCTISGLFGGCWSGDSVRACARERKAVRA